MSDITCNGCGKKIPEELAIFRVVSMGPRAAFDIEFCKECALKIDKEALEKEQLKQFPTGTTFS